MIEALVIVTVAAGMFALGRIDRELQDDDRG